MHKILLHNLLLFNRGAVCEYVGLCPHADLLYLDLYCVESIVSWSAHNLGSTSIFRSLVCVIMTTNSN